MEQQSCCADFGMPDLEKFVEAEGKVAES